MNDIQENMDVILGFKGLIDPISVNLLQSIGKQIKLPPICHIFFILSPIYTFPGNYSNSYFKFQPFRHYH